MKESQNKKLYEHIDAYLNGELKGDELKAFEDILNIDDKLKQEVEKQKQSDKLFKQIDAYLNNELKEDELNAFEELLKTDNKLKLEVEKYKLVQSALKDTSSIDFRKKLQDIDSEINTKVSSKKPVFKLSRVNWKVAAVLVAFIGLMSLLFLQNRESKHEKLFASYYVTYPMEDITRGEISSHTSLNKLALSYNNGNYERVIELLESNEDIETNDKLKLYLGNSYLNINKEDKAIEVFQTINTDSKFYSDGQWFLALTYLKKGKKDKVFPILENLNANNNLYTNKASRLIKALNAK